MQLAKTPLELKLVRETGRIADIGLAAVEDLATVGTEERAVMATAEAAVRGAGAEATTILVGSNATVAGPLAVARPLRAGDTLQVSVELAGPGGYWVQAVRTLPIGSIRPSVDKAIEACRDLEARLAAHLVAGNPVAGLDRIAETIYVDGLKPAVPVWHGVGLGMGEAPTAERGLDWNLREGMVIVLHPNLFNGDVGVFLGNTYAVGATGPIPITGPEGA
jgi:Xaa-Pro dipeptidase